MNDKASDLETYTASLNTETDWTSGVDVVSDAAWPEQAPRVVEFGHRVIEDALLEGTARYWERRARAFDAAGLTEEAQACRNRAAVERWQEADPAVVLAEWRAQTRD